LKKTSNSYAIILSSTFGEEEDLILSYLRHVSEICSVVRANYSIVPVLVFEKVEDEKRIYITKKLVAEKFYVSPILLTNKSGKGFSSCLNYGIKKTKSKYIFRLDTDDKTTPQRLIAQIEIMDSQKLDMTCGYMKDHNNKLLKYPSTRKGIAIMAALGTNPIAHPTVCISRESLYFLYDESLSRCEDFDLWLRFFLSSSFNIKVLKNPITKYSVSRSFLKDKDNALNQIKIRLKYIKRIFIIPCFVTRLDT